MPAKPNDETRFGHVWVLKWALVSPVVERRRVKTKTKEYIVEEMYLSYEKNVDRPGVHVAVGVKLARGQHCLWRNLPSG